MNETGDAQTESESDDPLIVLAASIRSLDASLSDRYVTRREFNLRTIVGLAAIAALLFLAITNRVLFDQLRTTNERTQETNAQVVRTDQQIIDCTTPTPAHAHHRHSCYESGQANLAKAIKALNDAADARSQQLLEQIQQLQRSGP